jgi:hypothetical protein
VSISNPTILPISCSLRLPASDSMLCDPNVRSAQLGGSTAAVVVGAPGGVAAGLVQGGSEAEADDADAAVVGATDTAAGFSPSPVH